MSKDFKHEIKIYYEDTDAGGVVYYANYLKFLERARSEAIYSLGFTNLTLLSFNIFNSQILAPIYLSISEGDFLFHKKENPFSL